ncbi:hypothetical protein GOB93_20140 [Acetobacter musti]|uniref:JAB domain-containing protein n=1 Tax=Acetobacter musti TaxID=864732 RepID=A0ABX0JVN3_9PROT|nr:hypothetical protein [Acetobacter musti]NHN86884.1 hypothetical protein [Acetobacter musti]
MTGSSSKNVSYTDVRNYTEGKMLTWKNEYLDKYKILIERYAENKKENYWGIDFKSGKAGFSIGEEDKVDPPKELENLYDNSEAIISIHHTHPDERALSHPDLMLLMRPGVDEIWAYTPDFGIYGAKLQDKDNRNKYEEALGFIFSQNEYLFSRYIENVCRRTIEVNKDDYDILLPIARLMALENSGLILSNIRISDKIRRINNFLFVMDLLHRWLSEEIQKL